MRREVSRIRKSLLASAFVAALIVTTSSAPAQAMYYSGAQSSNNFCVKNPSVISTWADAINNGRNAWNNHSSFAGNITVSNSCTKLLQVGSYGLGWLALYTPGGSTSYNIKLDQTEIIAHLNATGYKLANVVKSVTAHEFGHALKLGHESATNLLMSQGRNRNSVTGPKTVEVNESNGYY